jgi:hypothetical protein
MVRDDILKRETDIRRWISDERSKSFICRELRCKPLTLESYLTKLGIVYKGSKGRKGSRTAQQRPAVSYLYKGSTIKAYELKQKLIRDGIKLAKCESCHLNTWFKNQIPLELHHINGDRFDNRLENLQILCPNCHALTENYSAKGRKKLTIVSDYEESERITYEQSLEPKPIGVLVFDSPTSYLEWQEANKGLIPLIKNHISDRNILLRTQECLNCGKPLIVRSQNKYCSIECFRVASRKTKRPSKDQLQELIWLKPTAQIALDFGVSDKAIEKWCKSYGIPKPPRGYWAKKQLSKSSD